MRPLPLPTIPSPPIAQEHARNRDGERLARLRATPATRPELIRFERQLGCELRESISAEGERDDEAAQRFQVEQRSPTADAELQEPKSDALAQLAPPRVVELKISRGAKTGHGGVLPAAKVPEQV